MATFVAAGIPTSIILKMLPLGFIRCDVTIFRGIGIHLLVEIDLEWILVIREYRFILIDFKQDFLVFYDPLIRLSANEWQKVMKI